MKLLLLFCIFFTKLYFVLCTVKIDGTTVTCKSGCCDGCKEHEWVSYLCDNCGASGVIVCAHDPTTSELTITGGSITALFVFILLLLFLWTLLERIFMGNNPKMGNISAFRRLTNLTELSFFPFYLSLSLSLSLSFFFAVVICFFLAFLSHTFAPFFNITV